MPSGNLVRVAKGWTASTIIGNRKRGTGILNNELYIGRLVWNRQKFIKNPQSGKRQARPNPQSAWVIEEVPDLRIIDQQTWDDAASAQYKRSRATRPDASPPIKVDGRQRRPKHLFSGIIKCGYCEGGVTLVSGSYYGCATRTNKGTCKNTTSVALDRLENTVLEALQSHLLTEDLTKTFMEEYVAEINRRRDEQSNAARERTARLAAVRVAIDNIVETIAVGQKGSALLEKLNSLEEERDNIEAQQARGISSNPIRLHPDLAKFYSRTVSDLRTALNHPDYREEAASLLRQLIDKIVVHPTNEGLALDITGDLAAMLMLSAKTQNGPTKGPINEIAIPLVAGVGFEPTTFRL